MLVDRAATSSSAQGCGGQVEAVRYYRSGTFAARRQSDFFTTAEKYNYFFSPNLL